MLLKLNLSLRLNEDPNGDFVEANVFIVLFSLCISFVIGGVNTCDEEEVAARLIVNLSSLACFVEDPSGAMIQSDD